MSCGSKICTSTDLPHIETAWLSSWLSRLLQKLRLLLERERPRQLWFELQKARQRGLLKDLDERMLKDIGLTREEADREARKRFWQ
jgi:uncharacterized protein YjiS (DUF1127 family)